MCKVEVTASKKLAKEQDPSKPSKIEWEHADANGPTDSLVVAYEMKNKQAFRTHYKDKECESPCQMGPGGKCWAPCPSGTLPTSPFGSCEAPAVCPMVIPFDALACGPSTGFYIDLMFEQLKLIRPVDADNSNSREIAADAAAVFALTMEHAQDCFVTTNCIKKPDFSVHKKTCDKLTWPGAFKDGYCVDHLGGTLSASQCNKKKFSTDGMCKFDGLPNGCSNNVNQGKWFVFSAKAFNQVHNGKLVNALPLANAAGFFIDPKKLTAKFASNAGKAPVLDCRQSYCMKLSSAMSAKNSASAFCDNDKCRKVVDVYWPKYSSALHKRNKGLNPGMCDAMAEE